MELLTKVQRSVFGTLAPGKITELFKLGEPGNHVAGIATDEAVAGFYEFLGFPHLLSAETARRAVARGVETGLFGYVTGRPVLGDDSRYQIDRSRVAFERTVVEDEIDLDSGFLIVPAALPEMPTTSGEMTGGGGTSEEGATQKTDETGTDTTSVEGSDFRKIILSFTAGQNDLYKAWNALANLAGPISIQATATAPEGYEKTKLENGVIEPLRELRLIEDD